MRPFRVKYILVYKSTSPVDLESSTSWITPCWAELARVKASESQRPRGTPIQAKTIYSLSAVDALVRRCRRRRRRRPRSRQAADEHLDGDVVGSDKFASEKSCQSGIQLEDALVVESCGQGCAVVMLT